MNCFWISRTLVPLPPLPLISMLGETFGFGESRWAHRNISPTLKLGGAGAGRGNTNHNKTKRCEYYSHLFFPSMDTRRGSFLQPKGHVPTAAAVSLCMSVGRSVGQAGGWTGRSLGRSVLVGGSEGRSARWAVGRWGGRAGRSVGVGRSVTRSNY